MSHHASDVAHFSTWVDVLRYHATHNRDKAAYTFLSDGNDVQSQMTYGDLQLRAKIVGSKLQALGAAGERALLLYPPGLEYIAAFMGCLYAGVAAVPAYPPQSSRSKRSLPRLQSIMADAQPAVVLTLSSLVESCRALFSQIAGLQVPQLLATDLLEIDCAGDWTEPVIKSETLAFLQYTSGSTTLPKGVMITHGNLLHNEWVISKAFEHTESSIVAGWLPLYHDMGLIGNVLQPLYHGLSCILMPPVAFLQNPARWLSAISRYKVTTSGGPNFAYEFCVQKIPPQERLNLDLSSWKVAFNGAEPIRHETLERFAKAFEPAGFRPEAFYPCYGLAESTLIVSGGKPGSPPVVRSFCKVALEKDRMAVLATSQEDARKLVGCGQDLDDGVAIVDPETQVELSEGRIGEIWVSGKSVAQGYWDREEQTRSSFRAYTAEKRKGPYLRTGDLGFICEGELFVAGRLKDLIIIRGRNHYPQDIELTVEKAHPALRSGCGAAFSIEVAGEERLVVVQEVERQHRNSDLKAVTIAIRQAIADEHELQVHAVLLIKFGGVPKTSSGKIQRYACRLGFLQNTLDILIADVIGDSTFVAKEEECLTREMIVAAGMTEGKARLETYLLNRAARILKTDPANLELTSSLSSFGLDSLMAIELAGRIETDLKVNLPMVKIIEAANLAELASSVLQLIAEDSQGKPPAGQDRIQPDQAPATRQNEQNIRTTSYEQEALWLLHQANEASSRAYNILLPLRLKGDLQVSALRRAINEIIRRHEILRTTFIMQEGILVQVSANNPELDIPMKDLGDLQEKERETELRRQAMELVQHPFDLEQGPLLQPTLYRLTDKEHVLLLAFHHIACDGWSIQILLQELTELYLAFSANQESPLGKVPLTYSGFIEKYHRNRHDGTWTVQMDYWRQNLGKGWPEVILPTDRLRNEVQNFDSSSEQVRIPVLTTEALQKLSQKEGVTLFIMLLAAFKALLCRCSGQEDLTIGSSVANRNCAEAQGIVGPFTNAVALRSRLEVNLNFRQVVDRVRQTVLGAFTHQNVPFDKVLRQLEVKQKAGQTSPFEVVFLYQNFLVPAWEMNGLSAQLDEFDSGMSNFDLALIIYPTAGELTASIRYKRDLFDPETIRELACSYIGVLEQIIKRPKIRLTELEVPRGLKDKAETARSHSQGQTIAIAATFTADLLDLSLNFWMQELDVPAQIQFAPYNQAFQQLLDSESLLARNKTGINVILVRLIDWLRYFKTSKNDLSHEDTLKRNVEELIQALKFATSQATVPHLVCICPSNPKEFSESVEPAFLQRMEDQLFVELENIKGVHLVRREELFNLYPVAQIFDDRTDEIGHVPFSSSFYTALGTVIARKIQALRTSPYKVIVLDCDQTIWKGVCGEDGALGVEIDQPRKALQEFMVAQQKAGMLICLCSKNSERDVLEVFERRSDMPLKLEHIAAWKINWQPKSRNLQELAMELNLGLDSFIFVDDNAVECAEVQAACPMVATLQLPEQAQDIPRFLQHVWSFDHLKVTEEDKQRTSLYQQNVKREQVREKSLTLEGFLSELELRCEIREMKPQEIARAAQLTLRTNQFNTTGIRRSESELEKLSGSEGYQCFVVEARDRFGDYGIVGFMATCNSGDALQVDSFLLSCRALGKRIEHQMVSHLGELGIKYGAKQVEVYFIETAKNQPALDFFEEIAGESRERSDGGWCYKLPVAGAAAVRNKSIPASSPHKISSNEQTPRIDRRANSETVMRIATELCDIAKIDEAITLRKQSFFPEMEGYIEAETPTQKMLVEIWSDVLRLERIGIYDNFFKLGGHSLLATVLISRIRKVFNLELPLNAILEQPTISQLAVIVEQELIGQLDADQMAAAMEELSGMSDEEISALLANESVPSRKEGE